jgi:hypothetical protein
MDYKKNNMSKDREKGRGNKRARLTRGSRNPKHGKRKHYIVHKLSRLNIGNSSATPRMQHVEATRGASRAGRGSTGTLVAHGAGKECRSMRRYPNRGRSGFRTICGGGQTAQGIFRASNMDGERYLSAPRGQQLAHMHPFRGGCLLDQLRP